MKIWTIEQFIDGMPQIEVCYSEAEAEARFDAHYRALWNEHMDGEPFPEDADTAHGILCGESVSDDELMWITCHDIADHPALIIARDALTKAEAVIGKLMQGDLNLFSDRGKMTDAYDTVADAAAVLAGRMAADEPEAAA